MKGEELAKWLEIEHRRYSFALKLLAYFKIALAALATAIMLFVTSRIIFRESLIKWPVIIIELFVFLTYVRLEWRERTHRLEVAMGELKTFEYELKTEKPY